MQAVEFSAADDWPLHGRLYGDPARCHAALLVVPAMGVAQRYYADFAEWLASHGWAVLSFDYRGIGASRPAAMQRSLRGLDADVTTWAEQDAAAALAWLDERLPAGTPVHWIGHSLGGQIFGMVPNRERVSRVVTVGCGTGYWLHNAAPTRRTVWWLWFVVCPVVLPLFGYFPGRRLRKVGDLPHGVMRQWRRWCLHPEYLVGVGGDAVRAAYAAVTTPILSLSFTDDEFMSRRNTETMHGFYAGARPELRRIAPRDVGVERIGHFGFFRSNFESTLWPQVRQWLTPQETRT